MHASMRYVQYYAVDIAVDIDVEKDAAIRSVSHWIYGKKLEIYVWRKKVTE